MLNLAPKPLDLFVPVCKELLSLFLQCYFQLNFLVIVEFLYFLTLETFRKKEEGFDINGLG